MILLDLLRALGQLGDPRVSRVLWRGVGLAALVLLAASWLLVRSAGWLLPDTVSLPWIGAVGWIDEAAGWALIPVALLLSVLLMVPVASAMTSVMLDGVADAVEARHYTGLPPVRPMPWPQAVRDSLGLFLIAVAAGGAALVASLLLPILAPVIFVAVNGLVLGREWFLLAAQRRQSPEEARALLSRNLPQVWAAGALLAVPMLVPVLNLVVPTLGAATLTHLYHRVAQDEVRR